MPLDLFTCRVYNRVMIRRVTLTRDAKKDLRKVPRHVAVKPMAWIELVESQGLEEARKIPGFHNEPLGGSRRR
jgi:proteic killer suppression protein